MTEEQFAEVRKVLKESKKIQQRLSNLRLQVGDPVMDLQEAEESICQAIDCLKDVEEGDWL